MVVVSNKGELKEFISQRIRQYGPKCDLNDIDISKVTDMSHLFYKSIFDGDISNWDVSNVKFMSYMFNNSCFKGDLYRWNVSKVRSMRDMFEDSPLEFREPSWYRDDD